MAQSSSKAVGPSPVKAVLFDSDGLLIASEHIYTIVVNKVLKPYGLEQKWDLKAKLMGMPERKAVETLLAHFWPPEKEGEIFARECPFTIDTFLSERNLDLDAEFAKVEPMPGAVRLVKHLAKHGIPICVATGSKTRNFDIKKSNNAELYDPFDGRFICGDDPRLDRERGKPFPDIFLLAAREGLREDHFKSVVRDLGAEHDGTFKGGEGGILVFEDAVGGVSAAKAAGMQVVWVPDQELVAAVGTNDPGATLTIDSLLDFKPELFGLPAFDD